MDSEFLGMFMAVVGAATVFFDCVFLYDWATVRFRRPTKKAASLSRGDESDLLTGFLFGDVALHRCTQHNVGNRNCWFSIRSLLRAGGRSGGVCPVRLVAVEVVLLARGSKPKSFFQGNCLSCRQAHSLFEECLFAAHAH
jgi:hypothetical protein